MNNIIKKELIDHVSIPIHIYNDKSYNNTRRNKLIIFGYCLNKYKIFKEYSYEKKINMIIDIETSCYNETVYKYDKNFSNNDNYNNGLNNNKIFYSLYHELCSKVSQNLDFESDIKSTYLSNLIFNNKIDPLKIASLSLMANLVKDNLG